MKLRLLSGILLLCVTLSACQPAAGLPVPEKPGGKAAQYGYIFKSQPNRLPQR